MAAARRVFVGMAMVALGMLTLTQCREPTEVTLELSTDTACQSLYKGTSITVGPAGQAIESQVPLTITLDCNADHSIGTFVLAPSGNKDAQWEVRVVTGIDVAPDQCTPDKQPNNPYNGCIVARRVMSFVPHTPLELPIEMLVDCKDVPCDALTTCVHGGCVSAQVPNPSQCEGPSNACDFADGSSPGDATTDQGVSGDGPVAIDAAEDGDAELAELNCIASCISNGPGEAVTFVTEAWSKICYCQACSADCVGATCSSGNVPSATATCVDCLTDLMQTQACPALTCPIVAPGWVPRPDCIQQIDGGGTGLGDCGINPDAGNDDTGGPDGGGQDSGLPDTGPAPDSGGPDSGGSDSGGPDAGGTDGSATGSCKTFTACLQACGE
jgi:hypothetical protein